MDKCNKFWAHVIIDFEVLISEEALTMGMKFLSFSKQVDRVLITTWWNFAEKYIFIGRLLKDGEQPTEYSDDDESPKSSPNESDKSGVTRRAKKEATSTDENETTSVNHQNLTS